VADYYLDHGLYPDYAAVPTWGAAQDGDGTATGLATPSTAEVVFTGVPSSGTIYVMGVVVSPTWATDANTCANNLATSINALATVAVSPSSFGTKSQVRNHLYARGPANGAPAGTCQVMTRQAAAAHAGLVAFTHTLNNVSSAGTINFVGGTGGAWGYLFNVGTMWPSAIAIGGYGAWCAAQPFAGLISPGSRVYIRANKTITATAAAYTLNPPTSISSVALPTYFIIDDSTIWADGVDPVLLINWPATASQSFIINLSSHLATRVVGKKYSSGTYSLQFKCTTASVTSASYFSISLGHNSCLSGTLLASHVLNTGFYSTISITANASTGTGQTVADIGIVTSSYAYPLLNADSYSSRTFRNIEIDNSGAVSPHSGLISAYSGSAGEIEISGIKATGFLAGSKLFVATTGIGASNILVTDADLGNITNLGPFACTYTNTSFSTLLRSAAVFSQLASRMFSIESIRGRTDWTPGLGFPVLAATLLDGIEKWSMRMLSSIVPGQCTDGRPHKSPRLSKINSLANGARAITLEYVLNDAVTAFNAGNLWATLSYIDTSGNPVYLTTHAPVTASALTASTNTGWSTWNGTKVTFVDGGTINFDRYKFTFSTPAGKDMASGCEVVANVYIGSSVANVQQVIFIDPDVSIV